ncbi:MAG: gamma-glutamyl-gamma-aminobutyrate hydrolase family protein [Burkholderiales bacterium]|nr:gamma-glutamyl-gamma-aminobutyrate hydrolase family protein [Burkholderiales bacterium]
MRKPLIGITGSYSPEILTYVKSNYIRAIDKAGGVPFIIPPELPKDSVRHLSEICDGILITGGEDVDPRLYGQKPHPKLGEVSPQRDILDKQIIEVCLKDEIPFLAICRGMQAVNVFLGGTLIQDIDSAIQTETKHVQPEHYTTLTHEVIEVSNSTILRDIMGSSKIMVNSRHHQAVDKPGKNVAIIARSTTDGIAEALVVLKHPFGLAVQWHPEWLVWDRPEHLALFKALINVA